MPLYLLLASDDASSSASLLLSGGQAIDDLATAVKDLGGEVLSLAVTSGDFTLGGLYGTS